MTFIKWFFAGVAAALGWGFITNPLGMILGCGCLSLIGIFLGFTFLSALLGFLSGEWTLLLVGFIIASTMIWIRNRPITKKEEEEKIA